MYPISALTGDGIDGLNEWLVPGSTIALLGPSGVGKSTLVNTLAGHDLAATGAVRSQVREGKTHMLTSAMQAGLTVGMQTLEMALENAVTQGRITPATALEFKTALAQSGKARMP